MEHEDALHALRPNQHIYLPKPSLNATHVSHFVFHRIREHVGLENSIFRRGLTACLRRTNEIPGSVSQEAWDKCQNDGSWLETQSGAKECRADTKGIEKRRSSSCSARFWTDGLIPMLSSGRLALSTCGKMIQSLKAFLVDCWLNNRFGNNLWDQLRS